MKQIISLFYRYKFVLLNAIILAAIIIAFFTKSDKFQSFCIGLTGGIILANLGREMHQAKSRRGKKIQGNSESVNG